MSAALKTEGPAEVAASPSRGSTPSRKDKDMNVQTNSTSWRPSAIAEANLDDVQLAVTDLRVVLDVNKGLLLDMPFVRDGKRDTALDQVNSMVSVACTMAERIETMIEENYNVICGRVPAGNQTDPIIAAIAAYRDGMRRFNETPFSDDESDKMIEVTYGPPMRTLMEWQEPARSQRGAIEALRMAKDEMSHHADSDVAAAMVAAALAYLEEAAT